jgi:AP-3 complex subunit beta
LFLELVVAESVVVIKKLLQTHQGSHGDIVGQMARLVNRITVPQARAAILWLVGEHCEKKRVSKMAPDVLRFMARTFANEVSFITCNENSNMKLFTICIIIISKM